jgi:hypothetical protein
MTLKLAVAGADFVAGVAGWALVTLAQPAASATGTVIAARAVASRRDAVMTMRRVPGRYGSGCRCAANPRARDAARWRPVLTMGVPVEEKRGRARRPGRHGGRAPQLADLANRYRRAAGAAGGRARARRSPGHGGCRIQRPTPPGASSNRCLNSRAAAMRPGKGPVLVVKVRAVFGIVARSESPWARGLCSATFVIRMYLLRIW